MPALREWIDRLLGTLRLRRRDDADLEEELRSHLEMASEDARRQGQPPHDATRIARMRYGGLPQATEAVRDQRGLPWLEALASDLIFAGRHLKKHRAATAAAVLSLGLAVGATTAAFRLVNAVLWRTLPVAEPERLFVIGWNATTSQGDTEYRDELDYPTFRRYSAIVGSRAELMVIGMTGSPQPIVFGPGDEQERISKQYVSGNVFSTFGLQPALGRLLTRSDDATPGGHPFAVIGYDYWTRRFARDPAVLGKTFRFGKQSYEIVGVAPRGFTGTEPGRITDVFLPAAMNVQALTSPGWSWFRAWVRPAAGVSAEQVRQLLQADFLNEHKNTLSRFPPGATQQRIDSYLAEQLQLDPAGAGASGPQRSLRRPLLILSSLVVLVLLIACANVANLLAAQAITRGREMALRVSIGAGRLRLIQLVLVECLLLAACASAVGALFAWWAAPFVVSLVDFGEPLRLVLDADSRTLAVGFGLTIVVTALFGLAPALRASSTQPIGSLKIRTDPRAHRRLARSIVGAQMVFCVFVLFVAGLFVTTLANLSNRPLGFDYDHALLIDAQFSGNQSPQIWTEVADRLKAVTGVESVALANWVPLSENRWTASVHVPGRPIVENPTFFLAVSPAFIDTMRIGLVAGRDLRLTDRAPKLDQKTPPQSGVGIVNEAFARAYFNGENPVGRQVTVVQSNDVSAGLEIVGLVQDSVYYSVREPMRPTVFVPAEARNQGTLIVRTAGDPLLLAPTLRSEAARARTDIRAMNVAPYGALVRRQMVRERLLAILSLFFATLAVLLAGIGLYGVLNYTVIQQRREIGVRMALGARAAHVVRRVATDMLGPVGFGCAVGMAAGLAFGRLVEAILFEVKATDPATVVTPLAVLLAAAVLAAFPPAVRAVRIDPAQTLRSE